MNTQAIDLPLRDMHLPDPISWWPLATGWWMACGVVFLLLLSSYMVLKRYSRITLKKQASKTLDQIASSFNETDNAAQCLSELSKFLRRVVISQEMMDSKAASLTGENWLCLLDKRLDEPLFSQGVGRILLHGPYQPAVKNEDVAQLIELCRKWVMTL